jgi:hypothetical protein
MAFKPTTEQPKKQGLATTFVPSDAKPVAVQTQSARPPQSTKLNTVMATARPPSRPLFRDRNKPKTLDDLEVDERFQTHAQKVTEWLGTDDDIFETLRDSDYNLAQAFKRVYDAGKMPDDVKASYAYVRQEFDKADTGSFNQYMEATKDIGIDVITDPTVIGAVVAAPFTGGASLAARQAAATAVHAGTRKLLTAKLTGAVLGASLEGGTQAWTEEKIRESVGITDDVSGTKILASAAIGGVAGGLMGKFIDAQVLNRGAQVFNHNAVRQTSDRYLGDQALATAIATTVGKPATIMDPMTKVSEKAAELQKLFRHDLGRDFNKPFMTRHRREVSEADFNETANSLKGEMLTEFKQAVEPVAFNGRKLDIPTREKIVETLRIGEQKAQQAGTNQGIIDAANKIRATLDKRWDDLVNAGFLPAEREALDPNTGKPIKDPVTGKVQMESAYVENHVPRRWMREEIAKHPDKLANLFLQEGQAPDMASARKIVEGMLDIKNELPTPGGQVFNAQRKLLDIDDSKFSEFLDNDFASVMTEYIHQTSTKLATFRTFGVRNAEEFKETWINGIADDYKRQGLEFTGSDKKHLLDLYQGATGEGLERWGRFGQTVKDSLTLVNQLALLPMATLSSLTEIILPLIKANPVNFAKGTVMGIGSAAKHITVKTLDFVGKKHNLSESQVYKEMNEVGIALEEVAADSFERLAGEGLASKKLQKIQTGFFKANLLSDWTRLVQGTAFTIGKLEIQDNLDYLARVSDHDTNASIQKINELADLGIDYAEGIQWVNNGKLDTDPFYKNLIKGGSRFAESIVLPTNRAAGTKPLPMSSPKYDILFQLLGYPAVFSNTVLKDMAIQISERPVVGTAKIATAGIIMTGVARYLNYLRTDGESESEGDESLANYKALARWGGNGLVYDMFERAKANAEVMGPAGAVAGFFGPIVGDAVQAAAYRKNLASIVGTKIPLHQAGYTFLGKEKMDDYHTWLREQDKKIGELFGASQKNKAPSKNAYKTKSTK